MKKLLFFLIALGASDLYAQMPPTRANVIITDSIANTKVVGESGAVAMGNLYQAMAQSVANSAHNAAASQQNSYITSQIDSVSFMNLYMPILGTAGAGLPATSNILTSEVATPNPANPQPASAQTVDCKALNSYYQPKAWQNWNTDDRNTAIWLLNKQYPTQYSVAYLTAMSNQQLKTLINGLCK